MCLDSRQPVSLVFVMEGWACVWGGGGVEGGLLTDNSQGLRLHHSVLSSLSQNQ